MKEIKRKRKRGKESDINKKTKGNEGERENGKEERKIVRREGRYLGNRKIYRI